MTAARDNLGKPMLSFILQFPTAVEALARVKELGAIKYERDNWKKAGKPDQEYLDAILRHLLAFMECEMFAPDTGCTHLGHATWNIMALQDLNYKGITHDPELFKTMCEYWTLRRAAEKEGDTFMSVEEFMDKRREDEYLKLRQESYDLGFKKFPSFEEWKENRQASLDATDGVSTEELLEDIKERVPECFEGRPNPFGVHITPFIKQMDDLFSDMKDFTDPVEPRENRPQRYKDGTGSIEDYCPKTKVDMPDPKGTTAADISKGAGNWFADATDHATRQAAVNLIHNVADEPIEVDMEFEYVVDDQGEYTDEYNKALDDARNKAADELSRVMGISTEASMVALQATENAFNAGAYVPLKTREDVAKVIEDNQGYLLGKTNRPVEELIAEARPAIAEIDVLIAHPSHKLFIKQKQDEAFRRGYDQAKEDLLVKMNPETVPCEDLGCNCNA